MSEEGREVERGREGGGSEERGWRVGEKGREYSTKITTHVVVVFLFREQGCFYQ